MNVIRFTGSQKKLLMAIGVAILASLLSWNVLDRKERNMQRGSEMSRYVSQVFSTFAF